MTASLIPYSSASANLGYSCRRFSSSPRILALWWAFALCLLSASSAWSADVPLEARLIWGTNEEKPTNPDLKVVEPQVKEKLSSIFKWKNYFEVHRERFAAKLNETAKVRMSKKCRLEVVGLEQSWIEVKLFGEEKLVVKKRQALKAGELLVLAGDAVDNTAWFVVILTPSTPK
jgi:hypothetical protein